MLISLVMTACGVGSNEDLLNSSVEGSINGMYLISSIEPNSAAPGTPLRINGSGFSTKTSILIDGQPIVIDQRETDKLMVIKVPDGKPGIASLTVSQGNDRSQVTFIRLSNDSIPVIASADKSLFCKGLKAYSLDGELIEGERDCATPLPQCLNDGDTSCIATSTFPAVDTGSLGEKLLVGKTVAGVIGTAVLHPACSKDGEIACVANAEFTAAEIKNFGPEHVAVGHTVAGVIGARPEILPLCTIDGGLDCITSANFPAASSTGLANKIIATATVAGVTGNISLPTVDKVLASTQYGVGGTSFSGSLVLPPVGAVLNAETYGEGGNSRQGTIVSRGTWDVATVFPGIGYYAGINNIPTASLLSSAKVNNVSGSIENCTVDGSSCFLPLFASGTQNKKAIDYSTIDQSKMLNTLTISGKQGSIVNRGSWDITTAFPGDGYFTAISNAPTAFLTSSAKINNISGTLPTCGIDGSNCFLPTYSIGTQNKKAIDYSTIDTTKMLNTLTISGRTGAITDRGSWDITTIFPGSGFYTGVSNAPTAFLRASAKINNISGDIADCGADGSNCFLPVYASGTQNRKAIDYSTIDQSKMLSTLTISGKVGAIADRGTWDIATTFPGSGLYSGISNAPTAFLRSNAKINNVSGDIAACGDDGSNCFLPTYASGTQDKKAIDYSTIDQSKMLPTLTISGKTGTLANHGSWDLTTTFPGNGFYTGVTNAPTAALLSSAKINNISGAIATCGVDGSDCFLPTYAIGAQDKKAIDYSTIDQTKMLPTLTVSGKTGTLASHGSWDLTTAFPGSGFYTGVTNAPTASLRSTAKINNISGDIATCAVDGSDCFLPTYVNGTQNKKAIDYSTIDNAKMLSSLTISGRTGAITHRGNWDLDGSFPGAGYYSGVDNIPLNSEIRTGATVIGVNGNVDPSPLPCSSDSEMNCIANTNFKAANMLVAIPANIKSGLTIAGSLGTYGGGGIDPCSVDGAVGCMVNGTSFIAATKQSATPTNIRQGVQLAGVLGSYQGGTAVTLTEPTGNDDVIVPNGNYQLIFSSFSPDSNPGDGLITIYHRTDGLKTGCSGNPTSNGWTQLVSDLPDSDTSYTWNSVPFGVYDFCIKLVIGVNPPVFDVSRGNLKARNSLVFVTTTTFTGNFGSLASADVLCSTRATAAGFAFASSFKAILSTDAIHVKDRINLGAQVYNTADNIVASATTFWSKNHAQTILTDVGLNPGTVTAWTGTTSFGHSTGSNCSNWTIGTSGQTGSSGTVNDLARWSGHYMAITCNSANRLYCIGDK